MTHRILVVEEKNIPRRAQAKEKAKKVCTETIETAATADPIVTALIAMTPTITEDSSAELAPLAAPILQSKQFQ